MTVTATCGHDVTDDFKRGVYCEAMVARIDRAGARVVSYETVCNACRATIREANSLLESDAEAFGYLIGSINREAW